MHIGEGLVKRLWETTTYWSDCDWRWCSLWKDHLWSAWFSRTQAAAHTWAAIVRHLLLSTCAYIPTERKYAPNNKVCLILNNMLLIGNTLYLDYSFFHYVGSENGRVSGRWLNIRVEPVHISEWILTSELHLIMCDCSITFTIELSIYSFLLFLEWLFPSHSYQRMVCKMMREVTCQQLT